MRAMLSWLCNTRPDTFCAVPEIAQITEARFKENKISLIKDINKMEKHLKNNIFLTRKFPKLYKNALSFRVCYDASFETSENLSSQLGYFIFLKKVSNKCQPLFWTLFKSKRANRSVFGSEVMAFADTFDVAYVIKYDS